MIAVNEKTSEVLGLPLGMESQNEVNNKRKSLLLNGNRIGPKGCFRLDNTSKGQHMSTATL